MRLFAATLFTLALIAPAAPSAAAPKERLGSPLIDYDAFSQLTVEVRSYRNKRLLPVQTFMERAAKSDALLLDARSAQAFAAGHIKGAVNLPFTDFTEESLKAAIGPKRNRPIYIYCNNNFTDNKFPVVTKAIPLALNIQTFVNLYGYGYKNVWELGEAVPSSDLRIGWVTSRSAEGG
jgi:phage shock protein E